MRESTNRQLLDLSNTKREKVLELVCAPQPDAAEENTKQIDGAISAIGLRRIILTKAVGGAWERVQEDHYRSIIREGFRR